MSYNLNDRPNFENGVTRHAIGHQIHTQNSSSFQHLQNPVGLPPRGLSLRGSVAPNPNSSSSINQVSEQLRTFLLESSSHGHSAWQPNSYARSFVPQQLIAVNFAPAKLVWSEPMPTLDYAKYTLAFAGTDYLGAIEPITVAPAQQDRPEIPLRTSQLDPANYRTFFHIALSKEYDAQFKEYAKYNMYKVELAFDRREGFLFMRVPGLRENTPRVDIGDYIALRQLRLDPATSMPYMLPYMPSRPGSGQESTAGFTGFQHMACVFAVSRATETIYFRMDSSLSPESMVFNAAFAVPANRFQPLERAVLDIQTQLKSAKETPETDACRDSKEWILQMLFPEETHGKSQIGLPKGIFRRNWIDKMLNFEQQRAVDEILRQKYGKVPFLISGPPGTGKTKTLIEIALQWLVRPEESTSQHILLCAPSDQAADTLADRLRSHLTPKELFRLNAFSRSFAEVPDHLLPYCYANETAFSLPKFKTLMAYKVVVTTCRDADILVQARVTNRDLQALESGVLRAIHPQGAIPQQIMVSIVLHWTALLVDEAAQATEPEVNIPLTVVAPPQEGHPITPLIVMAGDQQQLGPRTSSKQLALETSLFERLFDRPIYKNHPQSRKPTRFQPSPETSMLRPPFANLVRNYRSHPAILAIPSALFYNDSLIPEATNTTSLQSWHHWQGRRWPVLFTVNSGNDEIEQEGGGWYNVLEARKACDYALSLITSNLITQKDICIMSPFPAQVKLLRQKIRNSPYMLHDVNIGPTEAFQGLEARVVILCTTRTRTRFLDDDRMRGVGIVNEAKRFNVALTRAKQGLIVIGNPHVLAVDCNWRAFLAFCRRNGLWRDDGAAAGGGLDDGGGRRGEEWFSGEVDATPAYISRLETGLVFGEREEGMMGRMGRSLGFEEEGEEDAMWVSGLAAEEALREEE